MNDENRSALVHSPFRARQIDDYFEMNIYLSKTPPPAIRTDLIMQRASEIKMNRNSMSGKRTMSKNMDRIRSRGENSAILIKGSISM